MARPCVVVVIGVGAAIDAYVAMLLSSPDRAGRQVLDGPAVTFMELTGIAVGARLEDLMQLTAPVPAAQFTVPASGHSSQTGSTTGFSSTVWSGSGDTVFGPDRAKSEALFELAATVLDADRTLRGSVSTAWITGGSFMQRQTDDGVFCAFEFRIDITRF